MAGGRASQSRPFSPASPGTRNRRPWRAYLLSFTVSAVVIWGAGTFAYIFFIPRVTYYSLERKVVTQGIDPSGSGGVPVNTLYTAPELASPSESNPLESTGNRDTLYTVGWLDLGSGPEVLHVPDMAGRYYAVQFTDPWGTVFDYVGRRTTGTQAGDYLVTGPGWKGAVPSGMKQIPAPDDTVLLIGRTLVEGDSDLAAAYAMAKQIQVTPLSQRQTGP